ncbi:MAG: transglycosylase SLT domain-containing protein [Sporichthyaceae bacterium]
MRGVLAAGVATACAAALLLVLAMGVLVLPRSASAAAAVGTAVPVEYRALIKAPGAKCPAITAPLLAAQLDAESNFNPRVVSRVGAMGIAQFMPGTWKYFARDVDGNGRASAFDPADAIDAQARHMCELYRTAVASGIPGDPVELALAGYNAGWGAVKKYNGIPKYRETQGYVRRIVSSIDRFTLEVAEFGRGYGGVYADAWTGPLARANPRGSAEAVEWARAQVANPSKNWFNLCLNFVAQAYGWRNSGVHYAIDHFAVGPENQRFRNDRNPPPGALMFWDTGRRAGHVALSLGGGQIASNDIVRYGRIDVVDASAPEREWGATYLGWTVPYFPQGKG